MQNKTDEKINSKSIPDKKDWLWRYMDLAKFINLLSTSKLFIPICSKFEDSREGHYAPKSEFKSVENNFFEKIKSEKFKPSSDIAFLRSEA